MSTRIRNVSYSGLISLIALQLASCTGQTKIQSGFADFDQDTMRREADYLTRGKEHINKRQFGLAVQEFSRELASHPTSVPALNGLAVAYSSIGRYDLADELFLRALSQQPESVELLNNSGYSNLIRGDIGTAKLLIERAAGANLSNQTVEANKKLLYDFVKLSSTRSGAKIDIRGAEVQAIHPIIRVVERKTSRDESFPILKRLNRGVVALLTQVHSPLLAEGKQLSKGESLPILKRLHRGIQILLTQVQSQLHWQFEEAEGISDDLQVVSIANGDLQEFKQHPSETHALISMVARHEGVPLADPTSVIETQYIETEAGTALNNFGELVPENLRDLNIEVSNGTGRRAMAARARAYLSKVGVPVKRLTNDETYTNHQSKLFFKKGLRARAEELAKLLPTDEIKYIEMGELGADIRFVLGADLLNFDENLIFEEKLIAAKLLMAQYHEPNRS